MRKYITEFPTTAKTLLDRTLRFKLVLINVNITMKYYYLLPRLSPKGYVSALFVGTSEKAFVA